MNRRSNSPTVGFTSWVRFAILALSGPFIAQAANPTTTVVIIRHAERVSFINSDSPLSVKGLRRADGLAYLLDQYHPAALFSSNRIRTQQTLRPLAERLHKPVNMWDYRQSDGLGRHLKASYPGQCVIVCWHHDHMEELARALGVQGKLPDWSLFTFNKIWIVTLGQNSCVQFRETCEWGNS